MKNRILSIKSYSLYLILVIAATLGCSCNILAPNNSPVLLWSSSISTGELIQGQVPITFVSSSQSVVALGSKQNKPIIYAVKNSDGTILWEWNDWFTPTSQVFTPFPYIQENYLVLNSSPDIFVLDVSKGKTLWKQQKTAIAELRGDGLGDTYFAVLRDTTLLSINIRTQEYRPLFSIPDTLQNARISFRSVTPFFDAQNNDTLLICTWTTGYFQNSIDGTSLLVYNLTKRKILYNLLQREGVATAQTGFLIPNKIPVVKDNKIYLSIGKSVQCNDLMTGELLWRKTGFEGDFSYSGLLYAEDKLYGIDTDGNFFCFNPLTGENIWKTTTTLGVEQPPKKLDKKKVFWVNTF
jgi:outer membrane protein assembly factor BamB